MNYIQEMFDLQQKLNDETNGEIWTEGATKEGRQISWLRCIYMEAAEALDSFNWKHWKDIDSEPDLENAKVELVDIWHFLMSEAIHFGDTGFMQAYAQIEANKDIDPEKLIEIFENMIAVAATGCIDKEKNVLYELTALFFNAMQNIGMELVDLYKIYLAKNQLNIFRQDHGYKDGNYQKMWGGVEDNKIALNIMEEHPNFTPKQLYAKLKEEYKQ